MTQDADLELIDGDVVVGLMIARPLERDGITPVGDGPLLIQESLVASGAGAQLSEWLEPVITEDWFPGIGIAYDAAPGCDTWTSPGYALPAGAPTEVTLPALGNSASPIYALAEYNGDIFAAQWGTASIPGRVLRSVGGTGAWTAWAPPAPLVAGEYVRDLLAADDGTGVYCLFASSSSATGANGRLHKWNGTVWTQTPLYPAVGSFGTNGRNRMVKVFWEGEDGVGDWRIVTLASQQGHISYTRPGGNPMTPADWVELVKVGGGEPILDLAAAKRHVYMSSAQNLYDLDEQGNSAAYLDYVQAHRNNALGCLYFDGFVYRGLGGVGLDRVDVSQGPIVQSAPGICSPGWGTKAESDWLTGYTTAISSYAGGILVAILSITGRPAVFWGKDRTDLGIETPNPLVWHGPFAIGNEQSIVTKMLPQVIVGSPERSRLWLATYSTSQVDPPKLSYISMPSLSGALQDLKSGGGHTFAVGSAGATPWQPYSRVYGLATTVGDKGSVKEIYQVTVGSRGLGDPAGTKLVGFVRADPAPTSTDWGTGTDILAGPTETFTPTVTSGNKLEGRIDLISPSGAASPPKPAILDSIRTTYWRTAPDLDTMTIPIAYGPGVLMLGNTHWPSQSRSVQWTTDALVDMCRAGRLVMRDRAGQRWSVKLKHFFTRQSSHHLQGATVRGEITVAILGTAV